MLPSGAAAGPSVNPPLMGCAARVEGTFELHVLRHNCLRRAATAAMCPPSFPPILVLSKDA